MAGPNIHYGGSIGDLGPEVGEEGLREVGRISDDMEVGMPLTPLRVVGDFEGVDTTINVSFPLGVPTKIREGDLEEFDLIREGIIAGDGSKSDELGCIECRHQLKKA
jgi:hypothetical protein